MTNEELTVWRAKVQQARTLIPRLLSGDELHREAAEEIQRLKNQYREDMREAERDARDAYQEGVWRERESHEERY